jgi:hypothetical protein
MKTQIKQLILILVTASILNGQKPSVDDNTKPALPPADFIGEVENSGEPEVIEELGRVRKEKDDLIKRIADKEENEGKLLKRIDELKNSKDSLERNLKTSSDLITELNKEKKQLKTNISALQVELDKPVGSLFAGWVYTPDSSWIYTSPKIYPYAFSQNDGWLKYELGTSPRRVFYFKQDEWRLLEGKITKNKK